MNLFLDTNVLLAYIFENEDFNPSSSKVINHAADKYLSTKVFEEYNQNCQKKMKIISIEFNKFFRRLARANTLDEIELDLQNICPKTIDLILDFLNRYDGMSITELKTMFLKHQVEIEKIIIENKKHISDCISSKNIKIHERFDAYFELFDVFLACGFVSDDLDDVIVVMDAHDLGLSLVNLLLITGDYTHIVSRREIIIENTSISDVIGLGEFNL